MRTIHELQQGSADWLAHRRNLLNASEAPAAMGASKYTTRSQLLQQKVTGFVPEVDAAKQAMFDRGHDVEAPTIALIEREIGDSLAPVVASIELEGLTLGASYDGITMLEDVAAEVKLWNEELAAQIRRGELQPHYYWQLEHQFIVTPTLERVILATSDGTSERFVFMEYRPVAGRREQLIAAWRQFDADLATFEPQPQAEKVTAAPVESLPAISARIEGSLSVHSNLDAFGKALHAFIDRIPKKPETDQQFADADAACKALKKAEEALDGAEANALGQVQTVETLTRTIADLRNVARTARLAAEKVVKARKDQIRVEECQRGRRAVDAHVAALNQQIGAPYMPEIVADFGAAISGLKSLDSLRAKVDQLIADKKIEANDVAGRITVNLRTLKAHGDYDFLFADLKTIVTKQPEDFQALIQSRVLAHQAEEKRRAEAAAERERERIRAEEQERARREAAEAARLQREQEEQRRRDEANAAAKNAADALAESRATESLPPQLQDALEDVASNLTADLAIGRAADTSRNVVPMSRPAATPQKPTLNLGAICTRYGITMTAAFVRQLGFAGTPGERSGTFFTEHEAFLIGEALIAHVRTVQVQHAQQHAA